MATIAISITARYARSPNSRGSLTALSFPMVRPASSASRHACRG
jgi:hypothetical protein